MEKQFLMLLLVKYCSSNFKISSNFKLAYSTQDEVLEIVKKIGVSEAAGVNKFYGRFLKRGSEVLATPKSLFCNFISFFGCIPRCSKICKGV